VIQSAHSRNLLAFSLLTFFVSLSLPSTRAQDAPTPHRDPYSKWLNEDVRWIISDSERVDFKKLWTNEQRDSFVVAFWDRRNPVPDTAKNAFKEEHYRRVAYANEHFAEGIPGWKTDRGRFYVMYGPPDYVVHHVPSDRAPQSPVIQKSDHNAEAWHWIYTEGLGSNVVLEFVDVCECGKYHLTRGEGEMDQRKLTPSPSSPCLIDQILCP